MITVAECIGKEVPMKEEQTDQIKWEEDGCSKLGGKDNKGMMKQKQGENKKGQETLAWGNWSDTGYFVQSWQYQNNY